MNAKRIVSMSGEPLGKRINEAIVAARKEAIRCREILDAIPNCDDELPPGSRLTWSHLNDVIRASIMIAQACELIEGLTPEALENE
jgi:hypothetical protein